MTKTTVFIKPICFELLLYLLLSTMIPQNAQTQDLDYLYKQIRALQDSVNFYKSYKDSLHVERMKRKGFEATLNEVLDQVIKPYDGNAFKIYYLDAQGMRQPFGKDGNAPTLSQVKAKWTIIFIFQVHPLDKRTFHLNIASETDKRPSVLLSLDPQHKDSKAVIKKGVVEYTYHLPPNDLLNVGESYNIVLTHERRQIDKDFLKINPDK